MINGIQGFSALSYLNQVKGVTPVAPVVREPAKPAQSTDNNASGPLQTGDGLGIPPSLLSLLQDSDAGSDSGQQLSQLLQSAQVSASDLSPADLLGGDDSSPIGGLLGTGAIPSALGGLIGASDESDPLLSSLQSQISTTDPFVQAISSSLQQQATQQAQKPAFEANLAAYRSGFNAYNRVLQENAQAAIRASQNVLNDITA